MLRDSLPLDLFDDVTGGFDNAPDFKPKPWKRLSLQRKHVVRIESCNELSKYMIAVQRPVYTLALTVKPIGDGPANLKHDLFSARSLLNQPSYSLLVHA